MAKCTLCVDRVGVGLEPACVKACPTGCLHFGTKDDMLELGAERVAQLQATGVGRAALYDPPGVGGTGVVTVLAHGDHPEWYGLPRDPRVPLAVSLWKRVLRPLGVLAILGAVVGPSGTSCASARGSRAPSATEVAVNPGDPVALGSGLPAGSLDREHEELAGELLVRHGLSTRAIHWSMTGFFLVAS
jgi:hypothetical protein